MLRDDPQEVISVLVKAIADGATPEQIGGAVAHAAFLRMARFHLSNEFRDWDTVHNTLTAANALHQALRRSSTPELLRGAFDIAMSIYLDRFLNMPPQRIPDSTPSRTPGPDQLDHLLDLVDVRQQVEESAHAVSGYLAAGDEPDALLATLGRMMLREDAGFHSFQIVDAAFPAVRVTPGNGVGTARADRPVQVPGGALPDAAGRGPDLPDRPPAAAGRGAVPVGPSMPIVRGVSCIGRWLRNYLKTRSRGLSPSFPLSRESTGTNGNLITATRSQSF